MKIKEKVLKVLRSPAHRYENDMLADEIIEIFNEDFLMIMAETTTEAQLNFWEKASDFQKGLLKNLKKAGYKLSYVK